MKSYTRYRFVLQRMTLNDSKRDSGIFLWQTFEKLGLLQHVSKAMPTATESIKLNKQLPAHAVSMEIYNGIARFPCVNTASSCVFRGVYPHLLMATNAPRSIFFAGGGESIKSLILTFNIQQYEFCAQI